MKKDEKKGKKMKKDEELPINIMIIYKLKKNEKSAASIDGAFFIACKG